MERLKLVGDGGYPHSPHLPLGSYDSNDRLALKCGRERGRGRAKEKQRRLRPTRTRREEANYLLTAFAVSQA